MYGQVVYNVKRPSEELLNKVNGIWAGTLADVMGRHGAMDHTIRPLYEGIELYGCALTVLCYPGDNIMVHKALQLAKPGDILVIDCGGSVDQSIIGYNITLQARRRGVKGMVTDGCIRDIRDIKRDKFPVFCYGVTPRSPQKNTAGSVNVSVEVGGVVVNPGDIVVGNDDGVAVVPLSIAEEIIEKARARMEMEHQQITDTSAGKITLDALMGGASWVDDILNGKIIEVGRKT